MAKVARQLFLGAGLSVSLAGCFKKVETIGGESPVAPPVLSSVTSGPTCAFTTASRPWVTTSNVDLDFACKPVSAEATAAVASVECRIDGGAWAACDSSTRHRFTLASEGAKRAEVRATAASGLVGPAARHNLNGDWTPPSIDQLNFEGQGGNVPTFRAVASDGTSGVESLSCQTTANGVASAWTECARGDERVIRLRGLQNTTSYDLDVKVRDRAGLESPPTRVSFVTAFVAPSQACDITPPVSPSRLRSLAAQFVCNSTHPIARVECQVDGGAWTTCQTPTTHTISGLNEGVHVFRVRYVDEAGFTSPDADRSWLVDLTPPLVQITSASTPGLAANFEFDASDANGLGRVECAIHKSGSTPSFVACDQNYGATGLESGRAYIFVVKASDLAGNVSQAAYNWNTTPPTGLPQCSFLTSFPNSYSTQSDVTVAFSCSSTHGPVSFPECKVGSGSWVACSTVGSHILRGLADGAAAELCVRTTDLWNRPSGPACLRWNVSLRAPAMRPLAIDVAHPYARLFFGAEASSCPVANYECKLDGPTSSHDWRSCESSLLYSNLVLNADYVFSARAATRCAQTSDPVTLRWKARAAYRGPVCRAAPTSGTAFPDWIASSPYAVAIACDADPAAQSFECSTDGTTWQACTSPYSIAASVTGDQIRYVRGIDDGGFPGPVSQVALRFDLDNPTVQVESLEWGSSDLKVFTRSQDVGSGVKEIRCSVDGVVANARCSTPQILTASALRTPGATHIFRVTATDHAGRNSPEAQHSWTNGGWSAWGACERQPDNSGRQTRTCTSPAPAGGGLVCAGAAAQTCTPPPPPPCANGATNSPTCTTCPAGMAFRGDGQCATIATNGGWGGWGACSATCGGGTQTRSCAQPRSLYASSTCDAGATQSQACNTGACCLAAGTYLGRGDPPGQIPAEVTCHSSSMPPPVVVSDSTLGCCNNRVRYSSPRVRTVITCGPGTNCSWCTPYIPGLNAPNHNWDDWEARCD